MKGNKHLHAVITDV